MSVGTLRWRLCAASGRHANVYVPIILLRNAYADLWKLPLAFGYAIIPLTF